MLTFDCGYFMQQDYIKLFVMKKMIEGEEEEQEEYNTHSLLADIRDWWFELPRDIRKRTPLPDIYVPAGKQSFEEGFIWVRSRRSVKAGSAEELSEIEADKIVKRRFLDAMGEGFNENELVFFAKPIPRS
ncbi:hypothetical protein BDZ97DRAFT_1918944 [Flammula alnicola]|nr:hypothetical protein BDZ97DRAFT_1918944 [Flammula alnicola]